MSTTPEDFYQFAKGILQAAGGSSEFEWRNAASRAYYAAFHCCKAVAGRFPLPPPSVQGGVHQILYAQLEAIPIGNGHPPENTKIKKMAYIAKFMKSTRVAADYAIDEGFDLDVAKQQLCDAKKVIDQWKAL